MLIRILRLDRRYACSIVPVDANALFNVIRVALKLPTKLTVNASPETLISSPRSNAPLISTDVSNTAVPVPFTVPISGSQEYAPV